MGTPKIICNTGWASLILLLLLISPLSLSAQEYELRINKVTNQRAEDPGATFGIAEDSLGFMWFGTVDGLYRFDGFNYKVFRNEKNNPNSLAWNTIRALCLDNHNRLWIATQGAGLDCFDPVKEKFTHYAVDPNRKNWITSNDLWAVICDHQGNIWTGVVGEGIDMLNPSTNTFRHYKIFPDKMNVKEKSTIRALLEDQFGVIWIGLERLGLSALDPITGKVVNYHFDYDDPGSLGGFDVYGIFTDHEGTLCVCSYNGGLEKFNRKTGKFLKFKSNPGNPNSLVSDLTRTGIEKSPGVYWIGTEYGMSIADLNRSVYNTFQHQKLSENSIADNRTRLIFKDRKGIVWLASEAGVDKIVEQHNFRVYKNVPGKPNSFPEGIVRAVLEDNQRNLWIGLIDKGLVRFDSTRKKMTRYNHNPYDPHSISGIHVTAIFQDSNGDLWFGEWDTGLSKYNKQTGSFDLIAGTAGTKVKLPDTRIQFIREAKPGVLWIGTENGISRLDTRTMKCTYMVHEPGNTNSLSGNAVQSNAFVQDPEGNLWIGTWSDGLNRVEFTDSTQQRARFTHFAYDPAKPGLLNNSNVISLYLDKNKILWIGTFGGGLNRYDIRKGSFTHYTVENGLPNNIIFGILEDDNHCLWLSTDRGISKFDKQTEIFQNFDKADGLQDDHFFWGATFKSMSGRLFFGGINGLNSFIPERIIRNTDPPTPVVTDLRIGDKSYFADHPGSSVSSIVVPYNQSNISFDYVALDYNDPNKNLYRIKMDGLDDALHAMGNRRTASYSNLAPGHFTFHLQVSNNDGVWSNKELAIKIIVKPQWWNTWLARSIFFLLIISGLVALYFIRLGILEARTHKLEMQVRTRTHEILQQKEELQMKQEELNARNKELAETLNSLKKTQNQLIQSEKMASLGTMMAGIAHEINNPVNFVSSGWQYINESIEKLLQLLKKYRSIRKEEFEKLSTEAIEYEKSIDLPYLEENYHTIGQNITIGIDRASEIIRSLNTFSRSEKDELKSYSLKEAIRSAVVILENRYKNRIEIIDRYEDAPDIWCNPGKINQVLLNIIGNAIDAIPGKGSIEISSSTDMDSRMVSISIKDSGIGIVAEQIPNVFDPFYTTKDVGKGTGLGLYISYAIIEQHQGTIHINSAPGKGTEVILSLPLEQ